MRIDSCASEGCPDIAEHNLLDRHGHLFQVSIAVLTAHWCDV